MKLIMTRILPFLNHVDSFVLERLSKKQRANFNTDMRTS